MTTQTHDKQYSKFLSALSEMIGAIEDNIINDEQRVANINNAWTVEGRKMENYR